MKRAGGREGVSSSRWPVWPFDVRERWLGADAVTLRNAPFVLFVVGILAYGAALAWYTVDRFDLVNLIREGYWDDAFYYFQIAYHMAEGRFSTFDGGVTRTNGYHPLWLFAITPFYWVFDKTEALFAVKAFEIVLLAGGVALVAVAARVARLPWILLFAVLPTLCAQDGMLWGMEAALVLFMLGLLMLAMCLFANDPARWKWPLAALAFALPWARLELAAVAAAATAALGLLEWSGRLSCAPGNALGGRSPGWAGRRSWAGFDLLRLQAAMPLAGAFAGVLVYFAYNGVLFGAAVPVSGAVKADVLTPRLWKEEGGYDLAKSFGAFAQSEAFDNELLIALEVCVYALLAWWLSRGVRGREDALLLAFVAGVFGLAAGHLVKFAQSVLMMYPQKGLSLWEWYFVPAHLMEALVVPLRCYVGIYVVRRLVGPKLPRASDALRLAAIAAAAVVLVAQADFAKPFRFVDTTRGDVVIDFDVRSYMGTAVLNRLLPEGTLAGSWDSGIVGYFSRAPVMNLDGLVNSYDYKNALESHVHIADFDHEVVLPEGGVHAFWRRHGVFHFGNVYGDHRLGEWAERGMLFEAARSLHPLKGGQFKLFRNDSERAEWTASPRDRAAWFRERMSPHLELQADGIGLLVEGRTVQAFAWDCTVDENEVAEWTFGGAVGAVGGWTQTADGMCSSDILLPHGHHSVRVRRAAFAEAVAGLGGGRPAIRADSTPRGGFDVYLGEDALYFAKAACEQTDLETPFFLHVVPIGDDLDESGEAVGYNNFDFMFEHHGTRFGKKGGRGSCFAAIPLPRYGIAEIRTGQYATADDRIWEGKIDLDQPAT